MSASRLTTPRRRPYDHDEWTKEKTATATTTVIAMQIKCCVSWAQGPTKEKYDEVNEGRYACMCVGESGEREKGARRRIRGPPRKSQICDEMPHTIHAIIDHPAGL